MSWYMPAIFLKEEKVAFDEAAWKLLWEEGTTKPQKKNVNQPKKQDTNRQTKKCDDYFGYKHIVTKLLSCA